MYASIVFSRLKYLDTTKYYTRIKVNLLESMAEMIINNCSVPILTYVMFFPSLCIGATEDDNIRTLTIT